MSHYPSIGIPFDWNHTMDRLYDTCHRPDYYMCMAQHDDVYTGVVAGHVTCHVFSPQVLAHEDVWYVRPDTPERTKTAIALMRDLMQWTKERGATMLLAADSASISPLAVDRLYRHLGFKRFGSLYKYQEEAS